MERVILHCDCNCFFASVEAALRPELNAGPFAVCGDPEYRHGIVLAKNEAAKRFGVKTGEAIWQAKAKCPKLKVVTPTYGKYKEFSEKIFAIYCRYTDLVEPFGIDECWLDVTGSQLLFGTGREIADELRRVIREEVGVTISAGVSYNKIFAKMGSDYKKPDATTEITRENFREMLYALPAGDLIFVGAHSAERLRQFGILTIGDIALAGQEFLSTILGEQGRVIYRYATGFDSSPVAHFSYRAAYKSIGNGMTFKRDLHSEADVRACVGFLCDKVSARLRKHAVECAGLTVGIRDTQMHTITRSVLLEHPTDLAEELRERALELIRKNSCVTREPIRALTVTGTRLLGHEEVFEQISFLDLEAQLKKQRLAALAQARDEIRSRYGNAALTRCSLLHNEFGI